MGICNCVVNSVVKRQLLQDEELISFISDLFLYTCDTCDI
jgi:hypothetical protein